MLPASLPLSLTTRQRLLESGTHSCTLASTYVRAHMCMNAACSHSLPSIHLPMEFSATAAVLILHFLCPTSRPDSGWYRQFLASPKLTIFSHTSFSPSEYFRIFLQAPGIPFLTAHKEDPTAGTVDFV